MTDRAARPSTSITVDLHCHSDASFDSSVHPFALVERAVHRRLSHLAITDHGTIEGALRARDAGIHWVDVIVGEEMRTTMGDVIGLFLERAIPNGLALEETVAAIREQGGIVGLPHPFDRHRPSVAARLDEDALEVVAGLIDYVEVRNGRLSDRTASVRALAFAATNGLPGVDASDAHTLVELGRVWTPLQGGASSAVELRAGLDRRVAETRELYERGPRAWHGLRRVRTAVRTLGRRAGATR
ncbi:MAG: PHP domain-containing protein [Chloroflexi bacterium]|nr:PHP domain-containing protein [Chloroflexota bacterium]